MKPLNDRTSPPQKHNHNETSPPPTQPSSLSPPSRRKLLVPPLNFWFYTFVAAVIAGSCAAVSEVYPYRCLAGISTATAALPESALEPICCPR
ncbi:hypothetical protein Tco_0574958, partial [Tanacetum coccineum]